MLIPPINTAGKFTFLAPYDTILNTTQEYKVVGVRSILELHNSTEAPCDTIYKPAGLTDADFQDDLNTDVPIIILSSTGGEYFYVPADRILSIPILTGIKYRGVIMAIDLGMMPLNYDFTLAKDIIANDIYNSIGVTSTVELVPSTAVTMLTTVEDDTFKQLLLSRKTVTKSWLTKYNELLELYTKQQLLYEELQICLANNCTPTV